MMVARFRRVISMVRVTPEATGAGLLHAARLARPAPPLDSWPVDGKKSCSRTDESSAVFTPKGKDTQRTTNPRWEKNTARIPGDWCHVYRDAASRPDRDQQDSVLSPILPLICDSDSCSALAHPATHSPAPRVPASEDALEPLQLARRIHRKSFWREAPVVAHSKGSVSGTQAMTMASEARIPVVGTAEGSPGRKLKRRIYLGFSATETVFPLMPIVFTNPGSCQLRRKGHCRIVFAITTCPILLVLSIAA